MRAREAGRELDGEVAERVFGWRWMAYPAPNLAERPLLAGLVPPEAPRRLCAPNGYDALWLPSDASARRFSTWDEMHWCDDEWKRGFPRYSTVDGLLVEQRMAEILAAAQKRGDTWPWPNANYLTLVRCGIGAGYAATFACVGDEWWEVPAENGGASGETASHAICLAALRALEDRDAMTARRGRRP